MKPTNLVKRGSVWYLRKVIAGKTHHQSLKTSDKETARARAKAIIEALAAGKFELVEQTRTKRPYSTVGQVLSIYAAHARALEVKDNSVRNAAGCLRRFVASALGLASPEAADGESLGCLGNGRGSATVRAWKAAVMREADGEDEEREQQIKRSANSQFRQVRALFKAEALELFQDHGLVLPKFDEFRAASDFAKVDSKSDYHPPSDDVLARTFTAIEELARGGAHERRMYLAICLAVGAGLRKGEIALARWSWFCEREGRPYLRGDQVTKNKALLDVPLLREWWARLQALRPADAAPEAFILGDDCSKTERSEKVFNRVAAWMTALGWQTEKKIHEFRAYVGSKIIQDHGVEAASAFLRHGQISTTQRYYGRYYRLRAVEVSIGNDLQTAVELTGAPPDSVQCRVGASGHKPQQN